MSMFDDLFGGMFDFNGDGETTLDEMMIANEIFFDDEKDEIDSRFDLNLYDDMDSDFDDFDF